MQQAKNSLSVFVFCENLASSFAIGLAIKVMCPRVGGGKAVTGTIRSMHLFIVSLALGQNMDFFFFLLSILGVFKRNFHSKLQGSAEPRRKPNYVKYSDLLVQKLNAVLQLSVYVPGAMHRHKILILRFPSSARSISDCHLTVKLRHFWTAVL